MGISFGSTGIKPYVGSKEVQEAYVGSQLVYKSGPPDNWIFIGEETSYFLSSDSELLTGTAIVKEGGIYRVSLAQKSTNGLKINTLKPGKLKFTAKGRGLNSARTGYVQWRNASGNPTGSTSFISGNDKYELQTLSPLSNAVSCVIFSDAQSPIYIDSIRFEE